MGVMGSYREIKGDLLELFDKGEFQMIAHGCNCHKIMGAGLAKSIVNRWPEVYKSDVNYKSNSGYAIERLGNFSATPINRSCGYLGSIINCYTQVTPGPCANLTAIRMCLIKINYDYIKSRTKHRSIGLPLIGCGIGGLNWEDVKPIIQEELRNMDVTVVHYEKNSK